MADVWYKKIKTCGNILKILKDKRIQKVLEGHRIPMKKLPFLDPGPVASRKVIGVPMIVTQIGKDGNRYP